jgi:hypothetical protein
MSKFLDDVESGAIQLPPVEEGAPVEEVGPMADSPKTVNQG